MAQLESSVWTINMKATFLSFYTSVGYQLAFLVSTYHKQTLPEKDLCATLCPGR